MTTAGFIKARKHTGLCKKMQSRVARTIKHARALGLFSYKYGIFRIMNPLETSSIYHREKQESKEYGIATRTHVPTEKVKVEGD